MKKFLAALILIGTLALAACGNSSSASSGNVVKMSATDFITKSLTVKVGTSVEFDSDGSHVIYTGNNAAYQAEAGAPSDLNNANGIVFNAGDKKSYIFSQAGTYAITCMVHPAMNMTITVTQ